jgi:hypothetical protein
MSETFPGPPMSETIPGLKTMSFLPNDEPTIQAHLDSVHLDPPEGKSARRPLAELLDAEVTKYTASQTEAEAEAKQLRADNAARDRKIAKALADVDAWKQETGEDVIRAKLADLAADSARRQLAELDRAKGRLAK